MNEPRNDLVVPSIVGAGIAAEVRRYGVRDVETGGFLVALGSEPMRVAVIAVAGTRGITRGPGLFRVSGKAIDRLFSWVDGQNMRIPAQFHSHGAGAFLSKTDRREGFNVKDFITCVVPNYIDPPSHPTAWGWWTFDGEDWTRLPPPRLTEVTAGFLVFDEDGVRNDE